MSPGAGTGSRRRAAAAAPDPRGVSSPSPTPALDGSPSASSSAWTASPSSSKDPSLAEIVADGIDPRILGLYHGVPLNRRSAASVRPTRHGAPVPRDLEHTFTTRAALTERIRMASARRRQLLRLATPGGPGGRSPTGDDRSQYCHRLRAASMLLRMEQGDVCAGFRWTSADRVWRVSAPPARAW